MPCSFPSACGLTLTLLCNTVNTVVAVWPTSPVLRLYTSNKQHTHTTLPFTIDRTGRSGALSVSQYLHHDAHELTDAFDGKQHHEHGEQELEESLRVIVHVGHPIYGGGAANGVEGNKRRLDNGAGDAVVGDPILSVLHYFGKSGM